VQAQKNHTQKSYTPKDGNSEDSAEPVIDKQQEFILVQVAERLFSDRGYHKVKFSDIARAGGISTREAQNYFPSKADICHQVIDSHLKRQSARFAEIDQNGNPRQRLSRFLDDIAADADILMARGCPLTNLYFDVHKESGPLAAHAVALMHQRLDWISQQFILITQVDGPADFAERLASALIGISILARVSGSSRLIRNQINQLKSWIRLM